MKTWRIRPVNLWLSVVYWCGVALLALAAELFTGCHAPPPPARCLPSPAPARWTPATFEWRPLAPAPPVERAAEDFGAVAVFRCPFDAVPNVDRLAWDAAVTQDLSGVESLEIPLRLKGHPSVSAISLYARSGGGWYHLALRHLAQPGQWGLVRVRLEAARTEGRPAGWSRIDGIRVAVWRGGTSAAELAMGPVAACGVLGEDMLVAVVRPGLEHGTAETGFARQLAEETAQELRSVGVRCALLDGEDVLERPVWKSARVLVLPYYPQPTPELVRRLQEFVEGGGRLIIAYTVPTALREVLGVDGGEYIRDERRRQFAEIRPRRSSLPGAPERLVQSSHNIHAFRPVLGRSEVLAEWWDAEGKTAGYAAVVGSAQGMVLSHVLFAEDRAARAQMWRAMVCHLAPEVGELAARTALDAIPEAVRQATWAEALDSIRRSSARRRSVAADLAAAQTARQSAIRCLERGRWVEALDHVGEARRRLVRAAAGAEPPTRLRWRGFWCHDAYGVRGHGWDDAVRRLAEHGFTAVLPNVCWGGVAFYPSQVLPVAEEVRERGDALAECLAAARRHGVEVHAWRVNWNLGRAPADFVERLRAEGRLQRGRDGTELLWLCPSHPDNRRLEVEAMLELARRYDVDGLHFDYIRCPDAEHCFCDGCRARFEAAIGRPVPNWPGDLRTVPWRDEWNEWRRRQISSLVEEVHLRVRALRPGLKLSAAVFREWERDRDLVAQDWKLWCERGWLDFVCPMNYIENAAQFQRLVERQREWAGAVPLCPGIGASASSSRLGVLDVIEQVRIAERLGAAGFVVFNYGVMEYEELIPLLGLGLLRSTR